MLMPREVAVWTYIFKFWWLAGVIVLTPGLIHFTRATRRLEIRQALISTLIKSLYLFDINMEFMYKKRFFDIGGREKTMKNKEEW